MWSLDRTSSPSVAWQLAPPAVALAVITLVGVQSGADAVTAAILYLCVVVLTSLWAGRVASLLTCVVSALCLDYFFTGVPFTLGVKETADKIGLMAFSTAGVGMALLITQLSSAARRSLQEIQTREARLREQAGLLDLTHDSIMVRDINDVVTYWNRGSEELYGWTPNEALGQVTHVLLRTVFPVPLEEIKAVLVTAGRWEGELVHTRRDGTQLIVGSRWSLQRDAAGRPIGTLEINIDISDRRAAEKAVQRQANLLDQTHDAIFVWQFAGPIVFWNRGAERLYGFSREEAVGRSSHVLLQTEHPQRTPIFEAALERDGEWTGELTQTTRDGRRILVESRHVLVQDADGRRLVLETNRDITDRKRAEEAARKAQAELAHVARVTTLGEMAASIAHEVDQPLSGVVINATASLRFLTGPMQDLDEVRDGLQAIARDGRRASDVIGRIRALARRATTEKGPLDMNEVVREVVALAEGEARRSRAILRTEVTPNLPRIVGDRVQLQQVVLNLLLNGLDAMHAVVDRPRDLLITTGPETPDRVHVAVRDAGGGIDPRVAHKLFDAFYTTKPDGMGMGLSISRSIIEQHGGRLWAETNDGPGTTFHFTV